MSGSVLVLHAGGTIGMVETPDGHAPVPGALAPYLDWIVENSRGELPAIEFRELDPPIDSANATPDDWCAIARILYEARAAHSGFVVLHGTDTMAYTSSALSFLLPSFGKPVVVTGSQIPITRTRSDGRQNLIGALQVAARSERAGGHAALRGGPAPRQPGHEDRRLGTRRVRLAQVPATRHDRHRHRREPRPRSLPAGGARAGRRTAGAGRSDATVPGVLRVHPREPLQTAAAGPGHRGLWCGQRSVATTGSSWQPSRPPQPRASSWSSSRSAFGDRCSRVPTRPDRRCCARAPCRAPT